MHNGASAEPVEPVGNQQMPHPVGEFVRRRERLAVAYGPERTCQFCERTLSAGDQVVYYGSTCDVTAPEAQVPIRLQRRYCSRCGPAEFQLPTTHATECLMAFEYAGGGELVDGEMQAVSRRGHGIAWNPTHLYDTVIQDVAATSLRSHRGIAPAGLLDVFYRTGMTPWVAITFDGSLVDPARRRRVTSILTDRQSGTLTEFSPPGSGTTR